MPILLPTIVAQIGDLIGIDGIMTDPLLVWPVAAEEASNSSNDAAEGNFHAAHGSLQGNGAPKMQDTSLASGRNTGTTFTAVTGSSYTTDNWKSIRYNQYGLLFDNSASGQTWDWVQSTTNTNIGCSQIVIRRGAFPNGVTPASSNTYAYLHLNYQGSNGDYRLRFAWGQVCALQYAADGTTWQTVDAAVPIGNVDRYFEGHADGMSLVVKPFPEDNLLMVEIDQKYILSHKPDPRIYSALVEDPTLGSYLPYGGSIRWTGSNGWTSLEVYPMRYQPLTLTRNPRKYGGLQNGSGTQRSHPQMGNAFIATNGKTASPTQQTNSVAGTQDGQNFTYTITTSLPDAGDGLGSSDAPRLSDATAIIPPNWSFDGAIGAALLQAELVHEVQIFDDQSRTLSTAGNILVNNWNDLYTGGVGRNTLWLYMSNGSDLNLYQRCRGVTGVGDAGLQFDFHAPFNKLVMPFRDFSVKMQEAIGVELTVDGWALPSAVLALATLGNMHPQYLQTIPVYLPPGSSPLAPYGPAGTDCPYYILPRGTGLNPKFKFTPEMSSWSCLQMLVQELGEPDPMTGRVIPYYMGFRWDGQFLFQPYDPFSAIPVASYSDVSNEAGTNPFKIWNLTVASSTEQMNTDVFFEGLDGYTNALTYVHIPQPDIVVRLQGYRRPRVERNARWATIDYLENVAVNAAIQSSVASQIIRFETTCWGGLTAGNVILVYSDKLGGTYPFVVIQLENRYGVEPNNTHSCWSTITARSIFGYY